MLRGELIESVVGVNKVNYNNCNTYLGGLAKLKIKMENIEERYALGKISEDICQKYMLQYQIRKIEIQNEMEKAKEALFEKKHQKEVIENRANDIPTMWQEGNLQVKRLIQLTVFPEGLYYNRETDTLRPVKSKEPELIIKDSNPT